MPNREAARGPEGLLQMLDEVKPVAMPQIEAARARLADLSVVSPVVACDAAPAGKTVYLKLENLQAIGSFKIRPIGNAVLARAPAELSSGIYTTSTGNSALGVAWMARRLGIAATAVVPANAPNAKLEKLRRLGARIDMRSAAEWWRAIETGTLEGQEGVYIDAVRDPASLAGDATIGLEILAQLPEIGAILIRFGGGVGFGSILPEMWQLASALIDDVITVSLAEVAAAIKIMVEHNRVVAEGAGAVSVAAALSGRYAETRVCAVVSGGNLDSSALEAIL